MSDKPTPEEMAREFLKAANCPDDGWSLKGCYLAGYAEGLKAGQGEIHLAKQDRDSWKSMHSILLDASNRAIVELVELEEQLEDRDAELTAEREAALGLVEALKQITSIRDGQIVAFQDLYEYRQAAAKVASDAIAAYKARNEVKDEAER